MSSLYAADFKACNKCKENLPLQRFGKDNKSPSNLRYTCKRCEQFATRRWKERNVEKMQDYNRQYSLKVKYSITKEQYNQIFTAQEGKCAICFKVSKRTLHVDHCHVTGKIRGLLCPKCNPGIGYFEENIANLEMAISYLKRFK